jgi:hypothetical protein
MPTQNVDRLGLYSSTDAAIDTGIIEVAIGGWTAEGYSISAAFASLSLDKAGDRTATTSETDEMKSDNNFTSYFNQSFFHGLAANTQNSGDNSYNDSALIDFGFLTSDLGDSYGRVVFNYSGSFTWTSGPNPQWSTVATFSVADTYDFDPASHDPFVAAFSRLQTNGYATAFTSTGSFTVDFSE